MLKRLSEYYTNDNKFFRTFPTAVLNTARFAAFWPDIDIYIWHNYGTALARGENGLNFDSYPNYVLSWLHLRMEDFNRIYDASVLTYNPLENYSMTEETATARKRGELENSTDSDIKPRVTAQYKTTNDDKSAGRLEGYSVGGLQSSNETPVSDGTENTTITSSYTETETLSTATLSATGHEVETIAHKRAGNIGVQSSQDMLNQEYDVRKRAFIKQFADAFNAECLTGLYAVDDDYYHGGFII